MATGSSNANEGVSAVGDGTIHLILQGKGGVGKSVIASWLAEFLISRGRGRRKCREATTCYIPRELALPSHS